MIIIYFASLSKQEMGGASQVQLCWGLLGAGGPCYMYMNYLHVLACATAQQPPSPGTLGSVPIAYLDSDLPAIAPRTTVFQLHYLRLVDQLLGWLRGKSHSGTTR